MEEEAVSPMVSSTAIPSVTQSLEDQKEKINGDVPTITSSSAASNDVEDLFNAVESTKDDDDGHRLTLTMEETECTTPVSSRCPSSARKKRGAFSLFRAVFRSFGRSEDSMKKTLDGGDTTSPKKRAIAAAVVEDDHMPAGGDVLPSWKSLVDGMRPLRLRGQELVEYYPPPPPLGQAVAGDVYHDVTLPPPSPARPAGFEFDDEVGMTSRYASAEDLHQMDSADDEAAAAALAAEGGGDGDGDSGCPHAIDMQAEEFIAKFYEQFKSESFNGRANE